MLCLLTRQSDSELTWYCCPAASSTDGNNYNFSSSGRPGVTRTPLTALGDLSVQQQLASGSVLCHCQSGRPLQNCLCATVMLRPGPGLGLPSPGPGNPSLSDTDPEGTCRRRHGQRGGCCWPCAGHQAPASRWRAPRFCIQHTDTIYRVCSASTLVVQWYEQPCSMHEVLGSNLETLFILPILIY